VTRGSTGKSEAAAFLEKFWINEVNATPAASSIRNRFTAYSAAQASVLISEGWFVLAFLLDRSDNMKPLF
jgi:hypothetical protein